MASRERAFEKFHNFRPHSGVVNAISRRRLGCDHRATAVNKAAIRVANAHPIRRGIRVNLHDHANAALLRQLQQQIQIVEIE